MHADIHHGPEPRLHTKAGYIRARPTSPSRKPLATHGRSIHLGSKADGARSASQPVVWMIRSIEVSSGVSLMAAITVWASSRSMCRETAKPKGCTSPDDESLG